MSRIKIKTYTDNAWLTYLDELAALEIEVFRSYPYLYDVTLEYEKEYLRTYAESGKSAMVLAFDGNTVVGASTCIPMTEVEEEVKSPFRNAPYPMQKVLYLGESILLKDYRKKGVGLAFYKHRERHALSLGMDYTAFCSIIRPKTHPLRPKNYRSLSQYWNKRGYHEHPEMKATMVWKDVGEQGESSKELIFWIKDLRNQPPGAVAGA
jgi:hypothetical protein